VRGCGRTRDSQRVIEETNDHVYTTPDNGVIVEPNHSLMSQA
jgi:S-adenosylmethionine hydrolase